jgi:hypothetical protein
MDRLHPIPRPQPPTSAPPTTLGEPGSSLWPARGDAAAGAVPAVSAEDRQALLTEVDSRCIAGNAGTVTLYMAAQPHAPRYLVDVDGAGGEHIARIATETPAEALDAFRHPFARSEVPYIFSTTES